MTAWHELATWLYGDVKRDRGFWYSHPLYELRGLTEDQLLWVPDDKNLCLLWHAGHIAHRERLHLGWFIQGLEGELIPPQYQVFGAEWCSADRVREVVDDVEDLYAWIGEVRDQSLDLIASLSDDDWHRVPPTSEFGMNTAQWLFATVSHGAIHIGKMQLLRAMLEGRPDPVC